MWADTFHTSFGFLIFDTISVVIASLLSGLNFLFVKMISKHHRCLVRKRTVRAAAIVSQLPFVAFLFLPLFMSGVGGPIPLLLILGLIIDQKIGVEPPRTPWSVEERIEQ